MLAWASSDLYCKIGHTVVHWQQARPDSASRSPSVASEIGVAKVVSQDEEDVGLSGSEESVRETEIRRKRVGMRSA